MQEKNLKKTPKSRITMWKKIFILATKKVKSRVFRRIIQNCPILIIIKLLKALQKYAMNNYEKNAKELHHDMKKMCFLQ